jgi:subtilisin family serine protease
MRVSVAAIAALAIAVACSEGPTAAKARPVAVRVSAEVEHAPQLIVMVRNDADPISVASDYGVETTRTFSYIFKGFSASVPDVARAGLRQDDRVAMMEPDATASIDEEWNLDRIDQSALPLDGSYAPPNAGDSAEAWIIDTGIRYTHVDFSPGRATFAFDAFGGDGVDCNGHGTHVSGIVGGTTYGVAKAIALRGVKVFQLCTSSTPYSAVLAGMDYVKANHGARAIVNMSLGGPESFSIDSAVAALVGDGVTVAVAAGNGSTDACTVSPAGAPAAITVSATNSADQRASFANFGSCVDIFAPGVGVTSDYATNDNATAQLSGTSMASPHVAGVAALILTDNPTFTPPQVDSTIAATSSKGVVINSLSPISDLIFSGRGEQAPPPPKPGRACPPGWQKRGLC